MNYRTTEIDSCEEGPRLLARTRDRGLPARLIASRLCGVSGPIPRHRG